VEGYAEDYAYLVFGLLELFQADGDASWLEWALTLQRRQDELFWDASEGGWFSTTGKDDSVLLRLKEDYDGAEPAASSISVVNLLTMSHLVSDEAATKGSSSLGSFSEKVNRTLQYFSPRLVQSGRAAPMMLAALSTYHTAASQLVLVGDPAAQDTRALSEVVRHSYLPTTIVIPLAPEHQQSLGDLLPWTKGMKDSGGRATAYLCRDFTCEAPTSDAQSLAALLKNA
jgi:uncharacterized protein YyaL (SSP411 family)